MYGLNHENGWCFSLGLMLLFSSWFFDTIEKNVKKKNET